MSNPFQSFLDAMRSAGHEPHRASDIKDGAPSTLIRTKDDGPGEKSLYAQFRSHPRPSGRWHDCRSDTGGFWPTKADKTWTDDERKAWKAEQDADRAAADLERKAEHERIAEAARTLWDASPPAQPDHAYLQRKRIGGAGLRQDGADLLSPLWIGEKLWSLQRIAPNGRKSYRGKKQGCYDIIGQPTDVICVGEGRATAQTAHDATGFMCYVAYDAGNLKSVAIAARRAHKNAKILILEDGDHWSFRAGKKPADIDTDNLPGNDPRWQEWREADLLQNAGHEKAKAAAAAVEGFAINPGIPDNDPERRTDFNDLYIVHGLEAVKSRILSVLAAQPEPSRELATLDEMEASRPPAHLYEEMAREIPLEYATEYDPAPKANRPTIKTSPVLSLSDIKAQMVWRKYPTKADGTDGKLEQNSSHNIVTYLRHHEALNGVFRLDVFSGNIILHRCPPWCAASTFKPREQNDIDLFKLTAWLERNTGLMPKNSTVWSAVCAVAEENCIDPPLEWMEHIVWDKQPRLDKLFSHYFGAKQQPTELLSALGRMWLIGGVARQYRPGCKLDNIIVLEGDGGAKKSTALETLATINGEKYFSDGLDFKDLKNKDTIAISRGKLILEFQELTGLGSMGMDGIIKWLTIKTDECRVPYARSPQKFHRRFLLAGTTNQGELPYHGGIRRFWNVICGEQLNCADLARDCEQLWAEAVYLYKAGTKWWIDHDDPLRRLVENEQRIRIIERALQQPVLDYLEEFTPHQVTASKVISGIGIAVSQRNAGTIREVNAILKEAGWISKVAKVEGKATRTWENPKFKPIDVEYVDQEEIAWPG